MTIAVIAYALIFTIFLWIALELIELWREDDLEDVIPFSLERPPASKTFHTSDTKSTISQQVHSPVIAAITKPQTTQADPKTIEQEAKEQEEFEHSELRELLE